ncbi:hypothetical protein Cgig2_002293 [Carnegiea gigantea]|uniref:Reverse transcriptase domain-containing protein n=1 Tax=Carnegiea gigantea TaxID=171969 RepID=A0A9Q1KVD0_9CARY|nr:hypothetical protein Cgig2_002293 [Carnegiea gigantea]
MSWWTHRKASCPLWLTPLHARSLSKSRELWRQQARPGLFVPSSTRWSMRGSPLIDQKGNRPPAPRNVAEGGHPMLRRPRPMTAPLRPQNARKYCEFHEQSGHTTTECQELKKALHELADKGQIDRFLKRGSWFLRQEQEPAPPSPRDEECLTEVMVIIAGGHAEGITQLAWKAQLKSAQQEVNPTGMIRLSVHCGDKIKSRSLEVDFVIVDVPTAYNVILGRPTLHKRGEEKTAGRDYTSGSPPSSCSSPSEAPALASRGLVASSSTTSPSVKGGIKSTSSRSRPFAAARSRSSTKPRNNGHLETRWQGSAQPCRGILGCQSDLAVSPPPWLGPHQPQPSPADAAALSCQPHRPPDPPAVFRSTVGSTRGALPAASTR